MSKRVIKKWKKIQNYIFNVTQTAPAESYLKELESYGPEAANAAVRPGRLGSSVTGGCLHKGTTEK